MTAREQGVIISLSDREGGGVIRRAEGADVKFYFSDFHQRPGSYLGWSRMVGTPVTFILVDTGAGLRAQDLAWE